MPDETGPTAHWVTSEDEARHLAERVVDPTRETLLIGVTTKKGLDRPLLDADGLAAQLGERAEVWVLTDTTHAWALTEALPPKIDVYGGAIRAWRPIPEGATPYPTDHPQWTIFTDGDAAKAEEQILAYVEMLDNPPPEFGTVATGTVTAVRKAGAEILLESGHPAFASTGHLLQHGEVFHAGEVLATGQEVRVKVGPWHAQAARVSVSLRDFAPDPWVRLDEVYAVGDVIDGVVSEIKHFGAFVELLPGVEGLLHKSKITNGFVEYVEDFVAPGDRISVRLLSLDPEYRKAEVSLLDVAEGDAPEPPASILVGGPPWLPDSPGAFEGEEPVAEADTEESESSANVATSGTPTFARETGIGPAFSKALGYMVHLHGEQVRKDLVGTPYVAHLMSVSALVLEHGGTEVDGVAALLHDAIEDAGGTDVEAEIARRFGPEVARIVRDTTDTDEDPKPPWRPRKEAYIAHIAEIDERAIRVSAADKLHNVRTLLADLRRDGDVVWGRFNAPKDDQLWVHQAYVEAFEQRLAALDAAGSRTAELVAELRSVVSQVVALVGAAPAAAEPATETPADASAETVA